MGCRGLTWGSGTGVGTQEESYESPKKIHKPMPCRAREKDERRAAPDFEATTKGVHRGPVRLPCAGDNGRLSPTHGSRTGPKEQHSWGSDDRGKFDRGGTPRHQWSRTPTRLIQGVNLPATVRLVNTNDGGIRQVLQR